MQGMYAIYDWGGPIYVCIYIYIYVYIYVYIYIYMMQCNGIQGLYA